MVIIKNIFILAADISPPSSIGNRLLIMTSKETTSTNDTKSVRLNRHRLPETQTSSGNSSPSVSTQSNEEKVNKITRTKKYFK
jgi:hypothetical protein